jgi:hypothetical protein
MGEKPLPFARSQNFYAMLGGFHAAWSRAEIVLECAIWKILGTTPEQAHILLAAMEFGRKAAILKSLLPGSNHSNQEKIKGCLTRITKSRRNAFSHSILASGDSSVTFVHRTAQGEYLATLHKFTPKSFATHVDDFRGLVLEFQKTVGLTDREVARFAAASSSLVFGKQVRGDSA